jgi:hypothetical protein
VEYGRSIGKEPEPPKEAAMSEVIIFTDSELDMLVSDGYSPGYMMDVQEGDLVAIRPVTRYGDKTVMTVVVQRLMTVSADYRDDEGRLVPHRVIVFIGADLDGRPHHLSYGNTYPCFYKR